MQSTFLAFERVAFVDTAGNLVSSGRLTTTAIQPQRFFGDLNVAALAGFKLNMEESRLLLTYDDVINPTVYNPLGVTFQKQPTFPSQVTGGDTQSTVTLGFVINATVTAGDLLQLKYRL